MPGDPGSNAVTLTPEGPSSLREAQAKDCTHVLDAPPTASNRAGHLGGGAELGVLSGDHQLITAGGEALGQLEPDAAGCSADQGERGRFGH